MALEILPEASLAWTPLHNGAAAPVGAAADSFRGPWPSIQSQSSITSFPDHQRDRSVVMPASQPYTTGDSRESEMMTTFVLSLGRVPFDYINSVCLHGSTTVAYSGPSSHNQEVQHDVLQRSLGSPDRQRRHGVAKRTSLPKRVPPRDLWRM